MKVILLGAVVAAVAAAGTVVALWPHDQEANDYSVTTAQHTVALTVENPRTGTNTLEFDVANRDGSPVTADTLTVDIVMPTMGHAAPPIIATNTDPGHYRARDATFSMSGSWEVTVRLPDDDLAVFSVPVR